MNRERNLVKFKEFIQNLYIKTDPYERSFLDLGRSLYTGLTVCLITEPTAFITDCYRSKVER